MSELCNVEKNRANLTLDLSLFIAVPNHEGLSIDIADPIELHKLVKSSGTYNFWGLKNPCPKSVECGR